MTLLHVVSNLSTYDEDLTIYAAKPWTPDSPAVVAREPDDGSVPQERATRGATYFIEVFVAKEFLEGWLSNVKPDASPKERCERLIQYAINDA